MLFAVKWAILPANGTTAQGLILPIVTLSLYPMAYITRLTRSSMLDVLGQDYIRTAKAKGVSGGTVMGTTIVLAVLIVVMNLISDILYKIVDPRINLE